MGGGLLGDDPIILYRETWSIGVYLGMNYSYFKDEDFVELNKELKFKPFIFAIEMENYYFYIRTVDNDLKVYCFDENEEKIEDTGMTFNEYMIYLVKTYNPKLEPALENPSVGNILVQCDVSEKIITGLKEIKEYVLSKNRENSELFNILVKYLEKNSREFIGYNDDELRGIEELYSIKVKREFREFLGIAGKSLGGTIGRKCTDYIQQLEREGKDLVKIYI